MRAREAALMDRIALPVAKHLDLYMARLRQILLDVDAIVAECGLGFRARRRKCNRQVVRAGRHLHAASAAAGGCLDEHREAHALGDLHRFAFGLHRPIGSGDHRNSKLFCRLLRLDLVAHDADVFRCRADKRNVVLFENFRETSVFR
jgi:hypothetical protein